MHDKNQDAEHSKKAIEISPEHFARVQRITRMGSWRLYLDTGMIEATAEGCRVYGIAEELFSFSEIKKIPLPEYREMLDRAMENLLQGTAEYDVEFRIKRADDGKMRYIHSVAEFDSEKRIVTGTIHDITRRKEIELALSDKEARYRSLFDNSVSGLVYVDTDGRILEINRKMLQLLGSPSIEETKKLNMLTFPLLIKVGFSADLEKVIKTGKSLSNSTNYVSKWDTTHFLEYDIIPIKDEDVLHGIMVKIEDITLKKQAETRIESLLKEKDIILREVHHRIKNNMNSMEGLLKLQIENSPDDNVRKELKDAVARLSSMRILYEKLYQSEDFMGTSSEEYLSKLIDDIAGVFPESENITIIKHIEDFMMPPEITFALGIIINEILTNALKYAFNVEGGNKVILVSANKKDNSVNIMVRDNGAGFPEPGEKPQRGFGLQLIRMLAEQIGGKAEFQNDGGAVVSIKFDI